MSDTNAPTCTHAYMHDICRHTHITHIVATSSAITKRLSYTPTLTSTHVSQYKLGYTHINVNAYIRAHADATSKVGAKPWSKSRWPKSESKAGGRSSYGTLCMCACVSKFGQYNYILCLIYA